MNIIEIYNKFPNHQTCIEHLEQIRWNGKPKCPYCNSETVSRKKEKNRQDRWQCSRCKKSFSVLKNTIFERTHLDLQKWFLAISLILDAKKGISSRQLARNLSLPVDTAWFLSHRIRKAMKSQDNLLSGIIEMDETYIGGKPRKKKYDDNDDFNKRGRGTKKKAVVGMLERKGKVKATSLLESLKGKNLKKLVKDNIDTANSVLMTDEFRGYLTMNKIIEHRVVNHQDWYVNGNNHTNGIESFWSLLKRGIIGQFHRVSAKFLEKYIDEFCYRFNARFMKQSQLFDMTLNNAIL